MLNMIILLLGAACELSHAFVPGNRPSRHIFLDYSRSKNIEAAPDERTSMTTLHLVGEVTKTSELAPFPNYEKLLEFFSLPDSPHTILRGSKNNHIVEIVEPSVSLLKSYQQQCRELNGESPTGDDKFFEVTTSGVDFPGLKVMTVATIGLNIFRCKKGLPNYQFVLVKDSTYAEGNRIFVWFFIKVTGKDKNKENEASTQSLNIIRTITAGDRIAFEANASLKIEVEFPSLLVKVLPGGIVKAEETGGSSLQRVLEADLPFALESFRQEYLDFLDDDDER